MIKVGIVGATGYTGSELLRLLVLHPKVEITVVTSRTEKGRPVADMFPHVRGYIDLPFTDPSVDELAGCDLIFFATPHGVAQSMMSEFIDSGLRTIDLSGDFRLKDVDVWESWYDQKHACPELIPQAAYGLPEIYREQIKDAKLVACPGCFPTVIQLGFLPLVEQGLVQADRLIADAKTGTSGAGRAAKVGMLLSECADSFKAYGVSGHRHLPEIQQILSEANGSPVNVTFVPHLVPMIRGIEATLYIQPKPDAELSLEQAQAIYEERYKDEPFVDVMPLGSLPETRSVKGSNMCRIALHQQPGSNTIIVLSVIDNLVKGSSGQAIQNMNLMFGFDEMMGLQQVALMP
ncbi:MULTISPECIES: N-acetyl-gamma-glutamyl-phosphate reductase [unclassified Oleiphilus]|nr:MULTISPECIES: N-acetyl-gamma-glutamyl-phosphate reductase [unclassified Oleiphilus]KZY43026.1 N-acetyl-gamma-glutamyl-phosphate reductase [Oleiphilus sp. HI0050]KZY72944.1 N-acetyl-gamma-glutamyl-phosphate reductase [Oleiphilus sp. HI0068]KZY83306.1 N-acetyl-gamma-glutamyl-phosphate reductase [Oleiphilus sp. HI0069]KZY95919.1 N-acetyl-gamma-glutamyl-phosphate reductase [Oleiphilus sp. HI0072]KZZ10490.1 N-acetyl-gamma-glutamyl-phosphate reductase [Oleiphilus sp. HI0078]KZZ20803.1 N-acetyl-g